MDKWKLCASQCKDWFVQCICTDVCFFFSQWICCTNHCQIFKKNFYLKTFPLEQSTMFMMNMSMTDKVRLIAEQLLKYECKCISLWKQLFYIQIFQENYGSAGMREIRLKLLLRARNLRKKEVESLQWQEPGQLVPPQHGAD